MITVKCVECGYPVVVDDLNPPEDTEVITCQGCGRQFGTYSDIEKVFAEAGKAELDTMIDEAGLPPWMIKK